MSIPILSYFSGGGFLDLGFEQAGFKVIWSNEISEEICKVYNSGMSSVFNKEFNITSNESIEEIEIKKIKKEITNKLKKQTWGIIGGPPCPDFSVGGKNKGKDGDVGKLSKVYVEHICSLKPSFFVFENVKGLVQTQKHREFFLELVETLVSNGYAIDYKILNALNFGVPQDRERIILIGIRKGLYRRLIRKNYKGKINWFPWPLEKYPKAKESFEWDRINDDEILETIPQELQVGNYILNQEELGLLRNSNEFFNPKSPKFQEIQEGDTSRKSFKRLHRHRFSPTVAYGNNEVHLHPILNRRLSVREALRLQSVPDTYEIDENITLSVKFKVIGNGVPVKLSHEIATSIKELLSKLV